MNSYLPLFKSELDAECIRILEWWIEHTQDEVNGGFHGKINNDNQVQPAVPRGSVLYSRILWTFSAAYRQYKDQRYLQVAEKAFKYITRYFLDEEYGGVYWSVEEKGKPHDTKKQVYAQAFALYGMTEYYLACGNEEAKKMAFDLYNTLEKHAHDTKRGGYAEAFGRKWDDIKDLRLSDKDFNEKKSMNTHLHVLEAYTNLYRMYASQKVRAGIMELINLFLHYIIDPLTHHLVLFFDDDWNAKSRIISYGHDIEAAWLLMEAAKAIADEALIDLVRYQSVKITRAAERGLDTDGGLWYEKEVATHHLIKEKHWWPQAEAMVGFYNTWQITGDEHYLNRSVNSWKFIKRYIIDQQNGEWFWGIKEDYTVMNEEDKAGLWKCPYHNGRACLEMIRRITQHESGNN